MYSASPSKFCGGGDAGGVAGNDDNCDGDMLSKSTDNCENDNGVSSEVAALFAGIALLFTAGTVDEGLFRALFFGKKLFCFAAASMFGSFLITVSALLRKLYLCNVECYARD